MMSEKFDRQVRLFGLETQEKISKMKIVVLGRDCPISSEIIKNLILLGVSEIITAEKHIKEVNSMIKGDISSINKATKITVLSSSDAKKYFKKNQPTTEGIYKKVVNGIKSSLSSVFKKTQEEEGDVFGFLIDKTVDDVKNFYFVCSKCKVFIKNSCTHETCEEIVPKFQKNNVCLIFAKDMLIGSTVVQEFIKMAQGAPEQAKEYFSTNKL